MVKVAVLVSGGGTNLQAIIDAKQAGTIPNGEICAVISSKEGVFALERAEKANIPSYVIAKKSYDNHVSYEKALTDKLNELGVGLIVLAGFMTVLSADFCRTFENKIINVHPSLIPAFCGDGFYGLHVHDAVLAKGVKLTGATVHFVNEITDGGAIIAQKAVEVHEDDSAETLQKRVMLEAEHKILPQVVSLFCDGKIKVDGQTTKIDN